MSVSYVSLTDAESLLRYFATHSVAFWYVQSVNFTKYCNLSSSEFSGKEITHLDSYRVCECSNVRELFCKLLYSQLTCKPHDAASTIAIQKASVRDVLRKMSPDTRKSRTSLCRKLPRRSTLSCSLKCSRTSSRRIRLGPSPPTKKRTSW